MNILMFGRGTIATLYGWALEKAGNRVDFYVRPGRAKQYGPEVDLRIRDGRADRKGAPVAEKWPITMREDLAADHDYDVIILSVNHNQLAEAVDFLGARVADATVLMFNNVWDEPSVVASQLPAEQVVWGFPGGGGGYTGSTLRGGIVKGMFLGRLGDSTRTERYRRVRDLFHRAGFSVAEQGDFRSWLWFHFMLDAGLMAQSLKAGSYRAMVQSRAAVRESILLVREMIPLLRAKGGTPRLGAALVSSVPAGLLAVAVQRLLGGDNMYSFIMEQVQGTGHASYDMTSIYPRDVLADARRLGVPLPRLAALEPMFGHRRPGPVGKPTP